MKKITIFAVVGLLILAFAASIVGAAAPEGRLQKNKVQLTDQQKQDLQPLYTKMVEIRKQIVQKYVELGVLTQEQADQRIAWMNKAPGEKRGTRPQMGPRPQINLTDTQKQELKPLFLQSLEVRKQMMNKFVEFGKMTQEQADRRYEAMKSRIENGQFNGIGHHGRFGKARRGHRIQLTDQQKQELQPLHNKMVENRKQILQKYVKFGVLTQEQADQRIAWMNKAPGEKRGTRPKMGPRPQINLTDAQKQEIKPLFLQSLEVRKQMMNKFVEFGKMTQEQADKRYEAMKSRIENGQFNGFGPSGKQGKRPRMGRGSANCQS